MIATVTNQGKARRMIIDGAFDADQLIEFLQALIKDAGRKVFLILDNLWVHHNRIVKAWMAERNDLIGLFYLPSYSPQLNPEEWLNANLKQEMGKHVSVRTKAKLREAANAQGDTGADSWTSSELLSEQARSIYSLILHRAGLINQFLMLRWCLTYQSIWARTMNISGFCPLVALAGLTLVKPLSMVLLVNTWA